MTDANVTSQSIFDEILGMRTDIRTMLTELAIVKTRNINADSIHLDHESRLRGLEKDAVRIKAIAATIASITGIVSGVVSSIVAHLH